MSGMTNSRKPSLLRAYLDDSGTHADSKVCVLAGYFGGQRQWVKFEEEWRKVLDEHGLDEFHAHRFWSAASGKNVSAYSGWNRQREANFLQRLLAIINSFRIHPFGSAVVMQDWDALPIDEKRVLTGAAYKDGEPVLSGARKKPFFLPFVHAIQKAASYCHEHTKISFYFDRNDACSAYAADYFSFLASLPGHPATPTLGEIEFVDSKSNPPIQAADLLAYEINRYLNEKLTKGVTELNPRPTLRKAIFKAKSWKRDLVLWDKRGMDIALRRYRMQKEARLAHATARPCVDDAHSG
jgi:hypothetical protein